MQSAVVHGRTRVTLCKALVEYQFVLINNCNMASKDTLNVRVKIEPGTSDEPSTSSTSVPLSERVTSIKMEPGLPTQRLTSYRVPRDLTLGGNIKTEKPKKTYMPNLNVQRNKKKDDPAISVKTESARLRNSDRGRERGRGDRGRGRGNILQSVGIFSEGLYTAPTPSRKSDGPRASSSTRNAAKYLEKSKLNTNKITDKTEEEKRLKNLLKDECINDDLDEKKYLMLPRIQNNIYDTTNDKIDKKPVVSENDKILKEESDQDTIFQIIENKANSYTLLQFPESLPGPESNREEAGSKPNDTSSESDSKAKTERCTFNSLRSGLLGKLEILKSGRARLRLGEMSFFVDIGVQEDFQQDLLGIKIDAASQTDEQYQLINLGSVNNKLICSPDFESMFEDS